MSTKPVVYVSDVIAEVVKLATEYPHAVYQPVDGTRCEYKSGRVEYGPTEQGCIFGQALRRLNVVFCDDLIPVVDLLKKLEIRSNPTVMDTIAAESLWCSNFQRYQDSGDSWGSILQRFGECKHTK